MPNKKISLFIIALLLLPLILQLVLAQEAEVPLLPSSLQPGNIEKTGEKIEETKEKLTNKEIRNNYLKQEWDKILLENKYVGVVYGFIKKGLVFLNPFFKAVLGIEYSLSWAFIFAIIIWIVLFLFIYPPASTVFDSKIFGLIASLAVTSLIGLSGVIKKATDILNTILTKKWLIWVALAITILIGIIIIKLGGGLKEILEKEKEKAAKEATEKHREIIKTSAQIEKKKLESYSEGGGI